MRLKISHLPNGVRVQTNKPYVNPEKTRWQASVMVITQKDGARGLIVPVEYYDCDVEAVWKRIHRASVKAICQHYKQNPELVSHITDRDMLISQDSAEVIPTVLSAGEGPKASPARRWILSRKK